MTYEYELVLKSVFKKYERSREYAVNNLSFEVKKGEFVAILGPSGCGKTTTMRMIAGLETITQGDIYIKGERVNDIPPNYRNIGLAFENYALYPPLTVYENMAFGLRARGLNESEVDKEVHKMASLLQIEHILNVKSTQLLEGDKQRVNIGRALIRKPAIILLDEPMSHLDGRTRQTLRTQIRRLHDEMGSTTILVTHDQIEALSMADRIVVMKDGQLQQFATPTELYNNPSNVFVASFIGDPPMNLFRVVINKEGENFYFVFPETKLKILVPERYKSLLKNNMEVFVGIRPTDVLIDTNGVEVVASIVENSGDEQRIGINVAKNELLTFVVKRDYKILEGDKIKIKFNPEKVNIFDVDTGERISSA